MFDIYSNWMGSIAYPRLEVHVHNMDFCEGSFRILSTGTQILHSFFGGLKSSSNAVLILDKVT